MPATADSIVCHVNDGRIWITAPFAAKPHCANLPGRKWDKKRGQWHAPATPLSALNITQAFDGWPAGRFGDAAFRDLLTAARAEQQANGLRHANDLPAIPARMYCTNWRSPCPSVVGDVDRFFAVDADPRAACPHCGDPVGSWLHQRQAFAVTAPRGRGLLYCGMGSGKSSVAVALADHWKAQRALVVSTPNASLVWPDQIAWHSTRTWVVCNDGGVSRHTGRPYANPSTRQRIDAAERALEQAEAWQRPCAIVIHYALLPHMKAWLYRMRDRFDLVIWDEIHNIKQPGGVWSKVAHQVSASIPHRLGLTGTLMPNSKLDVYGQARVIDEALFGTDFAKFRAEYAVVEEEAIYVPGGAQRVIPKVVGWRNAERFDERLSAITFHVGDDVLDLPDQHHVTVRYRLGAKASGMYRALEEEFVAVLAATQHELDTQLANGGGEHSNDGVVVARNALAKLMRLAQLANGHATVERDCPACGGAWEQAEGCSNCRGAGVIVEYGERVDDAFDKALAEQLDTLPQREPVVIMSRFRPDLACVEAICAEQGRAYGEVSGLRKDGITASGTMPKDRDVIGVQIQAGSEGVNFTRAAYCIYTSTGFDNGKYEQSLRRVRRPGQKRPVTFVHLIAELDDGTQTVNAVEYRALMTKTDAARAVAKAIRSAYRGS